MYMNDKKRYLKYHFPEIEDCGKLPVNYSFIQLFTGILNDEKGQGIPIAPDKTIGAHDYKIPEINLYPVFHKPISKCFTIDESKPEPEQKK